MATLFDYLDWRGDITFGEVGLNEVDSLILSMICYIDFDGIVPEKHDEKSIQLLAAARQYLRNHKGEQAYLGAILPPTLVTLLAKAAKTKRFGTLRLCGYVNRVNPETQIQFSALTYLLGNQNIYVSYRGTDDTLVGWKENFNMSFMEAVPAQLEAVKYLEKAAAIAQGGIYTGGHSKGGNLAVYATTKCSPETKEKIIMTYNNDGPGFSRNFISAPDYQSIKGKIRTLVPESSIVGMLLEHEETYEVVKSVQVGIMQHDSFSWEVLGSKFIHLNTISDESRKIDRTLKNWLNEMDSKQREDFVEAVYETLIATNASTLTDISTDKIKLLRAWNGLSEENRAIVMKSIRLLFKENLKLRKPKKK
ncbi:MAG: DUF2974 domain-containing protein [Clostridia bacterium]|nr:DUF2974 domain-containing protein [Clostridia bacterium]